MADLSEESALLYAHKILKDKDDIIIELKEKLRVEEGFSDNLNDLNVYLKAENRRLKDRLKVIVLPSSLECLRKMTRDQDTLIRTLRRYLCAALDLIPDTADNVSYKNELREFYDQIA